MDRKTPLAILPFEQEKDPILHRIDSLSKHLMTDKTGDYVDELLVLLINYASQWEGECQDPIIKFGTKIMEARFWLAEHFCPGLMEDEPDHKKDENKPAE